LRSLVWSADWGQLSRDTSTRKQSVHHLFAVGLDIYFAAAISPRPFPAPPTTRAAEAYPGVPWRIRGRCRIFEALS
jgi:hypothetical protein